MKYLVRFNKEDNSFIDMQTVVQEYMHKYYDAEELEEKQGHYIAYEYDKVQDKVIGKYIEIPKSEQELMHEEIEKLKRAIAENAPDTSELDALKASKRLSKASKRLSKEDLSELDNL